MLNEKLFNQKIDRRKFLLGGFSAGALTASALLLKQKVTLADSFKSPTEPQWQITVDGKLVQAGTFVDDLTKDLLIPVQNGTAHVILWFSSGEKLNQKKLSLPLMKYKRS